MSIYEFSIYILKPDFMPSYGCADSFVSVRIKLPARSSHEAFLILEHCFGSEIARSAVLLSQLTR